MQVSESDIKMGNIKETYFKLSPAQLALALIVLMAIEGGLMFKFGLEPHINAFKGAKADLATKKQTIETQKMSIMRLKQEITGEPGEILKPGDINILANKGNAVVSVSQKDLVTEEIKMLAEKTGGKNVKIIESPIRDAYISVGNKNRVFRAKILPLKVIMNSNFAGASNFMFQLKSTGKMLKLNGFELNADGYEGGTRATMSIDAYLAEGM